MSRKKTVADIYMSSYKSGLKGITVYREGAREGILISEKKKSESIESDPDDDLKDLPIKAPRMRPPQTEGVTTRMRTGEGSLYITINEDEHGLCEVFTTIGKAGGHAAAQSEAISRLISLALRSGIDPYDVVKQLRGISGPNPTWEKGSLILSTPDAIGRALEEYLNGTTNEVNPSSSEETSGTIFSMTDDLESKRAAANFNPRTMTTCPDCGSTVQHENGCVMCRSCGFSKCE